MQEPPPGEGDKLPTKQPAERNDHEAENDEPRKGQVDRQDRLRQGQRRVRIHLRLENVLSGRYRTFDGQ